MSDRAAFLTALTATLAAEAMSPSPGRRRYIPTDEELKKKRRIKNEKKKKRKLSRKSKQRNR